MGGAVFAPVIYLEILENSAVATGLEKVNFHSNPKRKAMPKNAQTTAQLDSSHTLVK